MRTEVTDKYTDSVCFLLLRFCEIPIAFFLYVCVSCSRCMHVHSADESTVQSVFVLTQCEFLSMNQTVYFIMHSMCLHCSLCPDFTIRV